MRRIHRTVLLALAVLAMAHTAAAQERSGGQLWVRAFEDRNGSAIRDAGEPLITRGIAVDLQDATGTVIASALIDNSPNATQGLVGFQFLPEGTYTAVVTSAYFNPTTANTFTVTISASAPPTVVEYGGQRAALIPAAEAETTPAEEQIATTRIAAAGLGALTVMAAMMSFGLLLYGVILRPRAIRAAQLEMIRATQTGSMRPVRSREDTGEHEPI